MARKRFVFVLIACSGLLLSGAGVSALLAGDGSDDDESGEDHPSVFAEPFHEGYSSLDALTTNSDLVVRGEVVDIAPGRTIEEEPGSVLEYERVTIDVSDAYWTRDDVERSEVIVEQRVRSRGSPVISLGMDPLEEGQDSLLFLKRVVPSLTEPGDETFVITGGYARFDVSDGSLVGPEVDDPVVTEVEGMPLSEFESRIGDIGARSTA